jgi:hypothetical protein
MLEREEVGLIFDLNIHLLQHLVVIRFFPMLTDKMLDKVTVLVQQDIKSLVENRLFHF